MKVRESGMPDEKLWSSFFDPACVLTALSFPSNNPVVVDFGCGYGTFTVEAAKRTSAAVYALDIDPQMTEETGRKARLLGLMNVRTIARDFIAEGTGLDDSSVDYVMLFNLLHAEHPVQLLLEARRILRDRRIAAVIHWKHDEQTPRGPPLNIRPSPRQCMDWLEKAGFSITYDVLSLPPYHFGLIARK